MSRAWMGGSTRRGRKLNAAILERDEYVCMIALPGTWVTRSGQTMHCAGRADCVHHTLGKTVTGDDPAFMVAACTPCNLKIGDPSRATKSDPAGRSATRW